MVDWQFYFFFEMTSNWLTCKFILLSDIYLADGSWRSWLKAKKVVRTKQAFKGSWKYIRSKWESNYHVLLRSLPNKLEKKYSRWLGLRETFLWSSEWLRKIEEASTTSFLVKEWYHFKVGACFRDISQGALTRCTILSRRIAFSASSSVSLITTFAIL